MRDCVGGQGTLCTKDQPCTPCDRSALNVSNQISLSITNISFVSFFRFSYDFFII